MPQTARTPVKGNAYDCETDAELWIILLEKFLVMMKSKFATRMILQMMRLLWKLESIQQYSNTACVACLRTEHGFIEVVYPQKLRE